jgi:hypothetical protein
MNVNHSRLEGIMLTALQPRTSQGEFDEGGYRCFGTSSVAGRRSRAVEKSENVRLT